MGTTGDRASSLRFVINPGHDGVRDKGAPGAVGTWEAEVNQKVARLLCMYSGDGLVYEPKRQSILGLWTLTHALRANPPDALASLHCNAARKHPPCIHEGRIYWWAEDPDRERRAQSLRLGAAICEQTEGRMAQRVVLCEAPYNRDGKPFLPGILVHTAKLAVVLVEMGFISDIHVALEMEKLHWQARTASALDAGIREWARGL